MMTIQKIVYLYLEGLMARTSSNASAAKPARTVEALPGYDAGAVMNTGDRLRGGLCLPVQETSSMLPAMEATVTAFDYGAVAELFPSRSEAELFPAGRRKLGRGPVGSRRFARSADAIRFAVEELPADLLPDVCLEVGQEMFDRDGVLRLYESSDYPLARRAT